MATRPVANIVAGLVVSISLDERIVNMNIKSLLCGFAAFAMAQFAFADFEPYDGQMEPGEYEISTLTQLTNFTKKVHLYDYAGSTIRLIADIDCGGGRFIYPSKRSSYSGHSSDVPILSKFCGTFDGGGHKIFNFYNRSGRDGWMPAHPALIDIRDGTEYPYDYHVPTEDVAYFQISHIPAGWCKDLSDDDGYGSFSLFDIVKDGAVIKNITLEGDVEFGYSGPSSSVYGVFVGQASEENAVTLENCHFTGRMARSADGTVGVFVGFCNASTSSDAGTCVTLSNCTASVSIDCPVIGGLVGYGIGVSATDCSVTGDISGIQDNGGGLAGLVVNSIFTRCSFTGTLAGELKRSDPKAYGWDARYCGCGGFAGYAGNTVFRDCTVEADIEWEMLERPFAGIDKYLPKGRSDMLAAVGGAAGVTRGGTQFLNCSFSGSVRSDYGYFGGFVGWTLGSETFSNCTAVASLSATTIKEAVGGFVGSVSSSNATFIACTAMPSGPAIQGGFLDAQFDETKTRQVADEEDPSGTAYILVTEVLRPVGTNNFISCSVLNTTVEGTGFARESKNAQFTDCVVSNVTAASAIFAGSATNSVFTGCSVIGGSATNGFVAATYGGNAFTNCVVTGARAVNGFVGSANPGEDGDTFRDCRVGCAFNNPAGMSCGFAGELNAGALVEDCIAYGAVISDTASGEEMTDRGELYGFAGTVGEGAVVRRSVGAILPPALEPRGAGFAGAVSNNATIVDSYAVYAPRVRAVNDDADPAGGVQAGFARYFNGTAERCFTLGAIPSASAGVGGCSTFVGANGSAWHFEDSFAPFVDGFHSFPDGVTPKAAAWFADAANFPESYDFENVWRAPDGNATSPYLAASTDAEGNFWTFVSAKGFGSVLVNGEEPKQSYPAGSVVTIRAVPGLGAAFTGWVGDNIADPTAMETTYTVKNAGAIYATFDVDVYNGQKTRGSYVILNDDQLRKLTEAARDYSYVGSTFVLVNDIDCGGRSLVSGEPDRLSSFWGTFDGRGYRIYNYRTVVDWYCEGAGGALFDTLAPGAVVKNLTLEGDVVIEDPYCAVAAVFASNAYIDHLNSTCPTIENCHFSGSISNVNSAAVFVGTTYRGPYAPELPTILLTNCTANATVFTATNAVAGGLVAKGLGVLAVDCSFEGRLEGGWTLGGLAGSDEGSTYTRCTFSGEMAGGPRGFTGSLKNGGCGGLVGFASNSVFRACSATAGIDWDYATAGGVRKDGTANFVAAGGAAGVTMGASIFDGCSFAGVVDSVHGYAGGFVGWTGGSELFTNCTAVASLNPTGSVVNVALGGFAASVGSREANFIDCTATAEGALAGFCDVQHKCKIGGEIGTNRFTRCTVASVQSGDAGFAGSPTNAVFSSCAVRGGSAFAGFVKTSGGGCEYSDCTVTGATVRIGFVETTKGENAFNRCRVACLYGFSPDDGTGYWGFAKELNAGAVVTACAAHGAISANNYADEEAQYGAGLFAKHIKGATLQGGCIGAVMQTMAAQVDKRIALLRDDEASVNDTWSLFEDDVPVDVPAAMTPSGRYWTHAVVVAGEGTILVDDKSPLASYEKNSVHQIRAVPADGYEFSHWVGVGYGDADSAETTYTARNIGAIAAAFAKKVGTPEELLAVSGNPTVPYVITGDIDLSGALPEVVNRPLLGDLKSRFLGRGHTISGLRFNDKTGGAITKTRAALFGRIKSGTQLRDLTVDVSASNSWALVSGLALTIEENTLVSNCTVNVDFRSVDCDVSKTVEYYGLASNVVGSAVTVMDCTVTGTMEASTRAAGFFGGVSLRSGEIARCASFCDVYATAPGGVASGFANSLDVGDGYGARVLVREIVTSGTIYGSDTGAGIAASVSIAHNDAMVRDMYSTAEVRAYTGYGVAAGIARTLYTPASGPSISNVWFGGTARAGLHKNYGFAETINSVTLVNCAFIDVPGVDMQWTTGAESIAIPFASRLSRESWTGYDLGGVWSMTEAQTTPYFAWSLDNGGFRILSTRSRGTTITRPAIAAPGASVAVKAGTTPSSDAFFVRWDGAAAYADGAAASTTFPADNHCTVSCIWGRNISTPAQLQAVTEDLSGIYHVVADIDMADFGFTTIGGVRYAQIDYSGNHDNYYNAYYPFFGIFDGQGHAISNVVARKSFSPHNESGMLGTFGGLFARLQEADVKDVRLVAPQIISFEHGGALAGEVVSSNVSGCSALGASVDGNESGSDSGYTGGLVGRTANSEISRSFAAGYVSGVKAGGFAGFVTSCSVRECFASGAVKATNAESGGFAGYIGGEAAVEDSYTVSEVEGGSGFAGTVGGSDVRIERCYSAGIASGASVGGFIGVSTGAPVITDCVRRHYDIEEKRGIRDVGSAGHANIIALTADEMRSVTNFTAFLEKEDTPWTQRDGATHPYFPWCLDENGKMPLVTMTIARNALAAPAVNFASLFGLTQVAPGGEVTITADSSKPSETFADGRTFLEWTGMNDDFGKPYLPQTLVKADNIRTAMALYGTMITSGSDLYNITNNLTGTYGLANDIVLPDGWASLYNYPTYYAFQGRLYGAGHTITADGKNNVFNTISNAYFRGVAIQGEFIHTGQTFGALSRTVKGGVTVQDCSVNGSITTDNSGLVGGFFGEVLNGTVAFERCSVQGSIQSQSCVGGFVGIVRSGSSSGTFIDCTSDVDISGHSNLAGMVGQIESKCGTFSFLRCVANGDVNGNGDGVSGFIGYSSSRIVCEDSQATGNVTSGGNSFPAGFIANLTSNAAQSLFRNCHASSCVTNTNSYMDGAGGFVGDVSAPCTTFTDCSASGDVYNCGQYSVGGFAGRVPGTNVVFTTCVASGTVTGISGLGGFVGAVTGNRSCFVDCEARGCVSARTHCRGSNCGGFAGTSGSSSAAITYEGCRALGGVSSSASDYIGGFVGCIAGADTYRRSMSAGLVKGDKYVGGFGGDFKCSGISVNECFALGDVVCHEGLVGGFAGYIERAAAISDSYATGNVTGWGDYVGGFAGYIDSSSSLNRCYMAGIVKGYAYQTGSFVGRLGSSVSVTNCAALLGGVSSYPIGIVPAHAIGNSYSNTTEHANIAELGGTSFRSYANFAAFHAAIAEDGETHIWSQVDGKTQPYLTWSAPDGNLSVYTLVYGSGGGTVSGGGEYEPGEEVEISATPDENRFFVGWTGSAPYADATNAHTTLTLDNHRVATTQFGRYIYDADELQAVTNDLDGVIGLACDINLSNLKVETEEGPQTTTWRPIGYPGNGYNFAFTGKFFGFGHAIDNLVCTNGFGGGTGYVGLFGDVSFATLDGIEVSGKVYGSQEVGGLVGRAKGCLITNCVARVEVNPLGSSRNGPFGGLVGEISGTTVVGCRADGFVKGGGRVGGLVGTAGYFSAFFDSAARGDVCGNNGGSGQSYGGFAGYLAIDTSWTPRKERDAVVSNCWCSGSVWGRSAAVGSFTGSGGRATSVIDCAVADGRTAKRRPGCDDDFPCRILSAEEVAERTAGWPAPLARDFSKAVHISTAEELAAVTNDLDGIYILDNDIDLKGVAWTPIGDNNNPFYGEFYGNGHMIRNLSVDGFFSSSVVRGGFFGCIGGRVNGLRVKGNVTVKSETSNDRCAGGFAGSIFSGAFVDDCSFRGDVTCWGDCAGGFSGRINDSAVVAGCCVTGAVRKVIVDTTNRGCGGFAGYMSPSSGGGVRIMDCYSLASVNSSPGESSGSGHSYAGGFVGRIDGTYTSNGKIETSYCSGSVTNAASYGGAFIGSIGNGVVTNSYYDCEATPRLAKGGNSSANSLAHTGITPLTHEAMLHAESFTNFDFVATWKIDEGETTPYLFATGKFLSKFEQWLADNGLNVNVDPSEAYNGIQYLIRYAFDVPHEAFSPFTGIGFDAEGRTVLSFRDLNEDADDVTLQVLSTTDLTDWSDAEVKPLALEPDGTFTFGHATTDPQRFYKLSGLGE